jgi:hypothetical protein
MTTNSLATTRSLDSASIALADALHDFLAASNADTSTVSGNTERSRANDEVVEAVRRMIRAEIRAMLSEV